MYVCIVYCMLFIRQVVFKKHDQFKLVLCQGTPNFEWKGKSYLIFGTLVLFPTEYDEYSIFVYLFPAFIEPMMLYIYGFW